MKNKKIFLCIGGISFAIVLMIAALVYGIYTVLFSQAQLVKPKETLGQDITAEAADTVKSDPRAEEKQDQASVSENELEEQESEALLDDAVEISDVYCMEGTAAFFYTYEPSADGYEWEFYNKNLADWSNVLELNDVRTGFQKDSYLRKISILKVPGSKAYDGMKFRCRIAGQDNVPTGSLHLIAPFDAIEVPEEYQADANKLLYTNDIPVTIVRGEEEEEIKGLQGLYFCFDVSSTEAVTKDENEVTKTVTTVSKEERSYMTMPGDNPIVLRYHDESGVESDHDINIIGLDNTPPEILSYEIRDYEVSAADTEEGVTVTVDIIAEDDCSDASELRYGFAPMPESEDGNESSEDYVPDNVELTEDSSISIETNTNGVYAIYVMDAAGNAAKETTELIVIDSSAPELSVHLEYPDMNVWHENNVIHVEAEDGTTLTYAYKCGTQDSGYITDDFYTVTANGTWTVSAKDAAGNVSFEEISISNIDHTAPKILDVSFSLPSASGSGQMDPETLLQMLADMTDEELRALAESLGLSTDSLLRSEMESLVKEYLESMKKDITSEVEKEISNGKNGIRGTDGKDGRNGIDGNDGADGKAGKDGVDGKTTFIAYADDAAGTNFSLVPLETSKYIGTCITTATKQPYEKTAYSNWQPYRSHIITDSIDEYGVTTMHVY